MKRMDEELKRLRAHWGKGARPHRENTTDEGAIDALRAEEQRAERAGDLGAWPRSATARSQDSTRSCTS